jgi:hypothetical protein
MRLRPRSPPLISTFASVRCAASARRSCVICIAQNFGQSVLDTCRADLGQAWLAWQDEIGRRHHRSGKNQSDSVAAAPHIPMRHVLALVMPISITIKPFLANRSHAPAEVKAMHVPWTRAVLLQAILWCRPMRKRGDF